MDAPLGKLLPFYLVVDVSFSMQGKKLDAANQMMPAVVDALAQAPILSDKVRFGLIDFADDARVRLPLCDPLDENITLPSLSLRGATSYAAAFRLLRTEIEQNVRQLKADGFAVHRPAVFFLSDGAPTDREEDWRAAYRDLTSFDKQTGQGFSMYPNVVPCGVDDAEPAVLRSLIHPSDGGKQMQMYLMEKGEDAAKAIGMIAEILISSVLASGESIAKGGSGLMLPDKLDLPAGIHAYAADDEDFV
jgi:uncharacterized protein YegL